MNIHTAYEEGYLVSSEASISEGSTCCAIPQEAYRTLESEIRNWKDENNPPWGLLRAIKGSNAIRLKQYAGLISCSDGTAIEILPKIGRIEQGSAEGDKKSAIETRARSALVRMMCCLPAFRHIRHQEANLATECGSLLEIYLMAFLSSVQIIIQQGLRRDYIEREENLSVLRGRLLITAQLRENLLRADRFYTRHDEYSEDRPINRLIATALRITLRRCSSVKAQRLARELTLIFEDIPDSHRPDLDFQKVRLDRGMQYYREALDWARLIINMLSPVSVKGEHRAVSLLFPMAQLFEAYVAHHLKHQLKEGYALSSQSGREYLIMHNSNKDQINPKRIFQLRPDLLIKKQVEKEKIYALVLDTKWKLISSDLNDNKESIYGKEPYGLSQSDIYQLYTYGSHYLGGEGEVILIYPETDQFKVPLPVFNFCKTTSLRLWVLPFCLEKPRLVLPSSDSRLSDYLDINDPGPIS